MTESLKDLEHRVLSSDRLEVKMENFTIGKGTAASTERWYIETYSRYYFGDSIEEVFEEFQSGKAIPDGYCHECLHISSLCTCPEDEEPDNCNQ